MSVDIQRTTRRCIPEDSTLHNHRCENLKSYGTYNINIALKREISHGSKTFLDSVMEMALSRSSYPNYGGNNFSYAVQQGTPPNLI
jgi:hypothetical protein